MAGVDRIAASRQVLRLLEGFDGAVAGAVDRRWRCLTQLLQRTEALRMAAKGRRG